MMVVVVMSFGLVVGWLVRVVRSPIGGLGVDASVTSGGRSLDRLLLAMSCSLDGCRRFAYSPTHDYDPPPIRLASSQTDAIPPHGCWSSS
jgi:hypothetical protein